MASDAHPNYDVIERFYAAFARLDGDAMAACYAPTARFSDPVFTDLQRDEPGAMWRMLTARANQLSVTLAEHEADDERGSAHWLADYTFRTGRRVHNDVRAEFQFKDGMITEHRDAFSFHGWARQALGTVGLLGGWTPAVRRKVQRDARWPTRQHTIRRLASGTSPSCSRCSGAHSQIESPTWGLRAARLAVLITVS